MKLVRYVLHKGYCGYGGYQEKTDELKLSDKTTPYNAECKAKELQDKEQSKNVRLVVRD